MQTTLFVWLGAKRAQKRGVGKKGILLDLAARAKLPVPSGGILLDDFYRLALEDSLFVMENGRFHVPDPQLLYNVIFNEVRFPQLEKPVAIGAVSAKLPLQLNVDIGQPNQLASRLSAVYSDFLATPEEVRRDLLVMTMVEQQITGQIISAKGAEEDKLIQNEEMRHLPRIGTWQRPSSNLAAFEMRLQKLMRGVRRTFGDEGWVVTWVDNGRDCWLLELEEEEPGGNDGKQR